MAVPSYPSLISIDRLANHPDWHDYFRIIFAKVAQDGWVSGGEDIAMHDGGALFALNEGEPVGVLAHHDSGNGLHWIDALYIFPDQRRMGHGKRLMNSILRIIKFKGQERVMMACRRDNRQLERFMDAHDFGATQNTRYFYPAGEPEFDAEASARREREILKAVRVHFPDAEIVSHETQANEYEAAHGA